MTELEISRNGDTLLLHPVKSGWNSFLRQEKTEADFTSDLADIVEEGRIKL